MKIIHLKHNKIDFEKYDKTLSECKWSRIYAMSWYLDIVSPNWELICTEDYNIVMPLPKKKKYAIPYLIQPMFCQQLGVFAKNQIQESQIRYFYKKLPYFYAILQGNSFDSIIFGKENLKPNYFIDSKNFDKQQKLYSKNTIRNLKKAESSENKIHNIGSLEFIQFITREASNIYNKKMQSLLINIVEKALNLDFGKIIASKIDNDLNAVAFVLDFNNRIYYLAPASSKRGKENQSMAFIVNYLIKQAVENNKILDFEGSSLSGVERFYKSFGADCEYYGIWKKVL